MLNNNAFPGVSIIMPAYNRALYIVETINSIHSQTYKNWELIIMDDQSDDDTERLVTGIKDDRIQYYKTEKRLGITGTRNAGMEKALNELIAFIDSDDLWADTKLEKQVAALQQYPGAGFSLTGGFNFRELAKPIDFFYKQRAGIKYDQLLIPYFRSEVSTTTSSLIFRKECLAVTGFFNKEKIFAEVDLILGLAMHFKGIILYEPLLFRRLHDSNISSASWEKGYDEGIALIGAYKKMLPPELARDALFRLYIHYGEDHLNHKKRIRAVNKFFKAWKNKPSSIIPLKKTGKAILSIFKN
ncbi:MAG: glycosyltransferase family A protein [Ferruginibacter sp.]